MDQSQRKMLAEVVSAKSFADKPLTGFAIQRLTEVFGRSEDGLRKQSIGYFKNSNIASTFANHESGKKFRSCGTREVYVLTNGTVAFLLDESEPVHLLDEKEAVREMREQVLAKLDSMDRMVLGI